MFTVNEINEFKSLGKEFPWIDNCEITSEYISFSDKMFHDKWRMLPNASKAGFRYSIQHCLKGMGFVYSNTGSSIRGALSNLDTLLCKRNMELNK